MRRVVWAVVASVVLVGVMFVTVFPTGTYLRQRRQLSHVSGQLATLRSENGALARQVKKLDTDAEIAKLAHQDYGLVRPGQEAYV
ncbi:MAG: FtsB family cell division protein, partial [Acidimicrobiales bacterium]